MDKIMIKNLRIYAYHGVHDFEKENGQNFCINATLYVDTYKAGHTDDLNATVSYSDTAKLINRVFTEEKYDLIECAAEKCARQVLTQFPLVRAVDLEVCKPEAPIGLEIDTVSVEIHRRWHKVYLSIGSNMGDKRAYIAKALKLLEEEEEIRITKVSSLIETKPYGGVEQDDFVNGALEIETLASPEDLLECIHKIERECDRERKIHWGPRTLDLDILFYDDLVMNTHNLTIPHADMVNRTFVLEPLKEIAPYMIHPVERLSITNLYNALIQ